MSLLHESRLSSKLHGSLLKMSGFADQHGQDAWIFLGPCLKYKATACFSAEVCAREDLVVSCISAYFAGSGLADSSSQRCSTLVSSLSE